MKILVLSDSHGAYVNLSYALEDNSDIKSVIYLGDGADDLSKVLYETAGRKVYSVCGNCDCAFNLPLERIETFDGKKVYLTHGHRENVKESLDTLKAKAREKGADIVLYGHTHIQHYEYDDGLYVFNPGTIGDGKYGIIDIENSSISIKPMKLW